MNQWQDTCHLCIPSRAQIIPATKREIKTERRMMNPSLKAKITTPQETATPKDSNAHSNGSSIGAHVSEVEEPGARSTQSVQEILATHAIDDPI